MPDDHNDYDGDDLLADCLAALLLIGGLAVGVLLSLYGLASLIADVAGWLA